MTGAARQPSLGAEGVDAWLTPGRFALLLALLVVATFPGILFGGTTFIIRDFGLFSYPVAYFHRQCFWRGELPLWNPFNNCGLPFLAQWNTLTLYPLSLIYLLLPLKWSLSFFCLAHLYWGGLGMYFLAQRWANNRLAAGLAGVIFSFNGLTLNFLMWPSHVATFSWLPWVLWLGQRAWREGGKALVWGTVAGAMQMLAGGPETIALTWLILSVLACGDWVRSGKRQDGRGQNQSEGSGTAEYAEYAETGHRRWRAFRRFLSPTYFGYDLASTGRIKLVSRFVGLGVLVALISAAQLLPFLELLVRSQRDTGFDRSDWPMPAWGWASFLVPIFHTSPTNLGLFMQTEQYWTSSYYAGIGTVLLVAVAVRRAPHWPVLVLAILLGLGLVLALGNTGLLYRGLRACLPALGFVRYPVKLVILILALAPLLAAFGLTALAGGSKPVGRFELGCAVVMLLLIGILVCLAARLPAADGDWHATWQNASTRAAFLVLALVFGIACLNSSGRQRILFGCFLLLVFWLDFVTHVPTQNPGVQPSVYTPGWASAHLKLAPQPRLGQSRIMLPPAAQQVFKTHAIAGLEENYLLQRLAFLADCNLLEEVPQVGGFFSLTPAEGNNATVLSYVQTNRDFPALLDFMGVSQLTAAGKALEWAPRPSAMPLVTAGQRPAFVDDRSAFQAFFQTNLDLRQIVLLPPEARGSVSATQRTSARVLEAKFGNQSVSIRTEAPAPSLVVISQTYYPAWRAYVDGHPARIWRANYAFQALQVPAGRHQVQLIYQDRVFWAGVILSGFGLLACAGLWLGAHSRKRPAWASPGLYVPS
jgi:hypothetical protein